MHTDGVRDLGAGANQTGLRAHNERLILTLIQRHGSMAGSEIARRTGLSAQTVSNILRKLETEGFLLRREPRRGRVGKPSVPMALDPDGALSFGLKIGRRSADLAVMSLTGEVLGRRQLTYRYPMPDRILGFLNEGMAALSRGLSPYRRARLCGIGIAAPLEIWSWREALGAPPEMELWRDLDIVEEVARFSALPLFTVNDATAACRAEHVHGRGRQFRDYAYFYIGSFIGGGIVLNSAVIEGAQRNAGALGSLRVAGPDGKVRSLLDLASLYLLEAAIAADGGDTALLWRQPQDWSGFAAHLAPWMDIAAPALARAARAACAVVDFEAVLIDGAFPPDIRAELTRRVAQDLAGLDMRGLVPPRIEEAAVGFDARVMGAAAAPIHAQFLLG
ncbi:ROK family transcriptional regulator [Mangrovicoccus algicola]|uniref:ROK family transcriptional regulator n=1 Tax=Mangrovicoccus algicola TaxID=2771008 RepID=A0A8J7CLY8_9RHOB|nr:ROK family transcriptional regulator [Mangrovicoccus algicola]MBE3640006.1 ROK family transcriptional regulator [Mangrovicoccus algicola]